MVSVSEKRINGKYEVHIRTSVNDEITIEDELDAKVVVMEKSLFQQIEDVLDELLSVMSEEDYVKFIEDDELLNIYDKVALLDNPEGILTDEVLAKILNLVKAKLELYK